ncbi:MAG: dicarboxylate/amino acid:cation symporter [Candidatus Marinimicrobia bacterium]|nr:dicarboxylate/amino acid:cation symporter [Candidatus Neomarinimicrobiota bacterium]
MKMKLYWQVLVAMVLGIAFALILKEQALIAKPLGTIFMRLLKMIIVPLIIFSITTGVINLGKNIGRVGAKTFGYYLLTSLLAIVIGLTLANLIKPGIGIDLGAVATEFDPESLSTPSSPFDIIIRMIPLNPFAAAVNGDILGIIFWCIIFGSVIPRLPDKQRDFLKQFFNAGFQAMMLLTQAIIKFLPIGVFGLISTAVATTGFELFKGVAWYIVTIAVGLTLHAFVVLPIIFLLFTRINPIKHYRAIASAMAAAFSTSSSGATLPVTMNCVETNAGVSNKISSFVLPLGATINMDGTALYECAGVLFISQALGFDLSFTQQFIIVIVAFLASVGAAAIPSAGLVMIFIVLDAVGLGNHPGAAMIVGTMLAVDRPLDMYRTVVNITSDSIGAVVVAKSEGEKNLYPNHENND